MELSRHRLLAGPVNMAFALVLLTISLTPSLTTPPPVSADTWVVTSLADDGEADTLRYAIENAEPYDTIRFRDGVVGVITLDSNRGPLEVDVPLTIEGPGASVLAVDGDGLIRVFVIETDFL